MFGLNNPDPAKWEEEEDVFDFDFLEEDEGVDEKIDWEEELEEKYGQKEDNYKASDKNKSSFARQKKIMVANNFYQGVKNKKISLIDKTKK